MDYPYKLEEVKKNSWGGYDYGDWIASPAAHPKDEVGQMLVKNRKDIWVLGEVSDAEANYSFEDYALIRLDGEHYLLVTSGCSCPSPSEEWSVVMGPSTVLEIRQYLTKDYDKAGYGMTNRQYDEFMAMCDNGEKF